MIHIEIREPIWKDRSIGIDVAKIKEDVKVDILYKTSDGKRLYPETYFIEKEKALMYPKKLIKKGVVLAIIPIADLKIFTPREYTQDEIDQIEYYRINNLPLPHNLKN